jgi:hypothetical protein
MLHQIHVRQLLSVMEFGYVCTPLVGAVVTRITAFVLNYQRAKDGPVKERSLVLTAESYEIV